MTVRVKYLLILGALASFSVSVWGARQMFAGALDPILRALHG